MYNVHLTHSLLCFEFVEFTLIYSFAEAEANLAFRVKCTMSVD